MIGQESTFTVLIVDDSSITRMIVQHVLRSSGVTGPRVVIIEAQNGSEGYDTAMRQRIDMIFSDLHMPGMTGLEMLERIRRDNRKPPPVVFVTSEKREEFIEQAMAMGAAAVITKPFSQVSFRQALWRVLAGKRA